MDTATQQEHLHNLVASDEWRLVVVPALKQRRDGLRDSISTKRYVSVEMLQDLRADQEQVRLLTQLLERPEEFLLPGE